MTRLLRQTTWEELAIPKLFSLLTFGKQGINDNALNQHLEVTWV
ncbi:hypothetical protein [Vibrio sp. Sgm 5]|nr:hypothetical protein [Vibrio sp. Sgm 5]MCX2789040.1 hypothetical protein [Vibrio sp. Sgm 5]